MKERFDAAIAKFKSNKGTGAKGAAPAAMKKASVKGGAGGFPFLEGWCGDPSDDEDVDSDEEDEDMDEDQDSEEEEEDEEDAMMGEDLEEDED